jgi:dihydroflavonol-4-reductase
MARILVTGASGFIGTHLVNALAARGDEVTCLVRKTSVVDRLRPLGVRLAYGEITDGESLAAAVGGQEIVFQLAGCLRALRVEQLYRVNQQGVARVARACAEQATPPVLVIVSSLAAMGPSRADRPRTASDPPAPVSNYGRSKLAGEQSVRQHAGRVPITIVRPPIVFGEGDPTTREIFAPIARFGVHLVPSYRDQRVSAIHADDLVNLLILAAERGKRLAAGVLDGPATAQGCYFAACEHDPTYAELGRMAGAALGLHRVWVVRTGPLAVWSVAGVYQALSWLSRRPWYFDLDKAREARAGSWTCSTAAAREELGFSVAAPLAERLKQTVDWYRRNGWL